MLGLRLLLRYVSQQTGAIQPRGCGAGYSNREVVGQCKPTSGYGPNLQDCICYVLCGGTLGELTKLWLIVSVYCFRYFK